MNWNNDRPTIRELFVEMKREDSRRVPPFPQLIAGQHRQSRWRLTWVPVVAATGFAAAGLCWLLFSFHAVPPRRSGIRLAGETPATAVALEQIQSISGWKAPTDTLLASSATTGLTQFQASTDALLGSGMTDGSGNRVE